MAELLGEPVGEAPVEQPARLPDGAVEERLARIEELLDQVEHVPGPTSDAAVETVQMLLEVYGEALARVVDVAPEATVDRLLDDELLQHLLALHGLLPGTVEERVQRALDDVRRQLEPRGGDVELLEIDGDVARIRLSGGGCGSCGSPDATLESAVADSVLALVPELDSVRPVADQVGGREALIPVEALFRAPVGAGTRAGSDPTTGPTSGPASGPGRPE